MKQFQRHNLDFFVVALALVLSACAMPERSAETALQQVSVSELEEVFAAGYTSITEKYMYSTTVENVAMDGLRGFGAIDPAISLRRGSGFVTFAVDGTDLARKPAPAVDDIRGWAALTAEFAKHTQRQSSEMQSTDSEHIYEAVFDGVLSNLDIFSRYAGAAEAMKNRAKRDGFGGIGIRFKFENGAATVSDVMPGMPAQRAGLMRNDVITHIDRIALKGLDASEVVSRMRGPTHTKVQLMVLRLDENVARQFEIKRTHIIPTTVTAKLENGILFLKVSNFNQGTSDSVATELEKAKQGSKLLRGLVIDLRGNGGGSLVEATEVTGLFIKTGPIVQVRDNKGAIKVNDDSNPNIAYKGPLVVLVDRQSASASEIFAGAIQDYGRGLVVGEPTYGKGTVQNVVDLNRFVAPDVGALGQLKVTIAQFFRINGSSTQHKGVVPDIIFPTALDIDTHGERALENALPWATVRAARYEPQAWMTTDIDEVRALHELRIKADAGFDYLLAETKARLALNEVNVVSLNEAQRKQEIDAREEESTDRLNKFRVSRGLEPLSKDPDDTETAASEDDSVDVLLDETAYILADVIHLGRTSGILQAELGTAESLTTEENR